MINKRKMRQTEISKKKTNVLTQKVQNKVYGILLSTAETRVDLMVFAHRDSLAVSYPFICNVRLVLI
jgi:indole-3-glycerol phosphate synthase